MLKKHIVITVNATWNAWNFRRPIIEALISSNMRVTLLAPKDKHVPQIVALGCKVRHIDMKVDGLNPLQDLMLIRRFRQVFSEDRPDIILSYTIKNNIFGALAARSLKIPFIPNVTGLGTAFLSGKALQTIAEGLYRRAFASLPVIFFQNEDDLSLFRERGLVNERQARLLPGSGIDLEHFSASEWSADSDPLFLMIARLLRDKGVVEFVDAARLVKQEWPEARFALLGAVDASNRSAIDKAQIDEWCDEGIVDHLGTVNDVRPLISSASCVVLPSYREGAPRTLIEAAAMARPLIATDVPGCRSVVEHGVTGYLCDARCSKSLASAQLEFLRQPKTRWLEMGQAGREKMEREFDQSHVVSAYLNAISELSQ